MDYKKAYEEALERAEIWQQHLYESDDKDYADELNYIFPELTQSDDEKIRKELLKHCLNRRDGKQICVDASDYRRWTAWLEKQGGDKEEPQFKVGDWITDGGLYPAHIEDIVDNKYEIEYTDDGSKGFHDINIIDEYYHDWTIQDAKDGDVLSQDSIPFIFKTFNNNCKAYCGITDFGLFKVVEDDFSWCNSINVTPATKEQRDLLFQKIKESGYEWDADEKELKKIEQKPDKDEPKFKVGDWISNGVAIWHIEDVNGKEYILGGISGVIKQASILFIDSKFHLWTIQDAKDGDVLICGNQTLLFKCIEEKQVYCYGYIWSNEYKELIGFQFLNQPNQTYCCIDAVMSPATKSQHDTLFAKMKEAGYSWDAEKKELKKIEQKPTNLPKGEDYGIDGLWHAINILERTIGEVEGYQSDDGILEHKCAITAVRDLAKKQCRKSLKGTLCDVFDDLMFGLDPSPKQSKQKSNKIEPKFKVGDTIEYFGERKELDNEPHTIECINEDMYVTTFGKKISFKYQDCYRIVKVAEQKSADKIEPKFKVGDVFTKKYTRDTIPIKVYEISYDANEPIYKLKPIRLCGDDVILGEEALIELYNKIN